MKSQQASKDSIVSADPAALASALDALLQGYRNGGAFPTYRQLADLSAQYPHVWLDSLLQEYREGGAMPTYDQLVHLVGYFNSIAKSPVLP